ncbi:hypothetical protein AAT19DRAFT_15622 [Rhodotorula toruloides]|uniref:Uncharacterized protein n=1 Tax=Rhodotorula toruloides TaxID=5286 RepID=A0A2T0A7S5_RHOTO|nr:hypothetical protein AAT19DRAFT_15622 [Rhodotorula toruloides]
MTRAVALLGVLPAIRKGFLTTLMLSGIFDMVASIVLLSYQLALTEGFQRVVPSIIVTSFFCAAFPVWFLYSRPYSIRLPGGADATVGGTRDKNASKFPGQGRVLEGEISDDRFKRDGSEAPVFPNSSNMTDSMYATDSILNASVLNSTGALDWDVQSGFSAGTRPSTMVGVSSGLASEPATPRDASPGIYPGRSFLRFPLPLRRAGRTAIGSTRQQNALHASRTGIASRATLTSAS